MSLNANGEVMHISKIPWQKGDVERWIISSKCDGVVKLQCSFTSGKHGVLIVGLAINIIINKYSPKSRYPHVLRVEI